MTEDQKAVVRQLVEAMETALPFLSLPEYHLEKRDVQTALAAGRALLEAAPQEPRPVTAQEDRWLRDAAKRSATVIDRGRLVAPQEPQPAAVPTYLPLPEAKAAIRCVTDENDGWIVDFECEGPLSHTPSEGEPLFTADQMIDYGRLAESAVLARVDAAPAAVQPVAAQSDTERDAARVQLGPEAFRFTSFQQWVDKAQGWFQTRMSDRARAGRRYLAVDDAGRVCLIGSDFHRARDEGTFPVVVYLIDAAMNAQPAGEQSDE